MADGPDKGSEVKSPEQSLQTRIQNAAQKILVEPNYRNDKGQLLVNPDGPISILPEQEWKMVRTKEFKEWFGDWENPDNEERSQIVGSNSEPLLVYHESPTAFDRFDEQHIGTKNDEGYYGRGFYFHSKKNVVLAGFYAGPEEKTVACFLNIRKPFLFTNEVPRWKGYYRWLLNRDKSTALAKAREILDLDGYKARLKRLQEGKIDKHRDIPQEADYDIYWEEELNREKQRIQRIIDQHSTFNNHLEEEYQELNANHDGVIVANEGEELNQTTAEIVAFKGDQVLISRWE